MNSNYVAVAASVLTIGLFTSPLKIAQEIRLSKSTGAYSPLPYLAMLLNCIVWALYGHNIEDKAVLIPNLVGLFISALVLNAFRNFSEADKYLTFVRLSQLYAVLAIVLLGWIYAFPPHEKKVSRLGLAGAGLSISMFAAPFATIKQVLVERNSASLPVPMITMGTLCTMSWTAYGQMIGNMNIFIPNAIGLLFSCVQLFLAGIFPRKPSLKAEVEKPETPTEA